MDVAAIDEGLQHLHLSVANYFRVGIEPRASQQQVIAFGRAIHQALRLLDSDREEVESNEKIDRRTGQAIIADHWNMFLVRGFHDTPSFARIVRQKYENIDAALEQFLDLAKLQIVVAIGGAGEDGTSELVGALLKFLEIGLPTFAIHGLDGEPDFDFLLLRLGNTQRQDDKNKQSSGEETRRTRHESISQGGSSRHNRESEPE